MTSDDGGASGLVPRESDPVHDTRPIPHVLPFAARAPVGRMRVATLPGTPAAVAAILLPSEHVEVIGRPHPFVFAQALVAIVVACVVHVIISEWTTIGIVHGRHVVEPLVRGPFSVVNGAVFVLALLGLCGVVLRQAAYYWGFRCVATNRRVFLVSGIVRRTVVPLGNSALAGATLIQMIDGRIFNFGTILLPQQLNGRRTLDTMRSPVNLYRQLAAVANGVEGDTWTSAIRQTLIP